MTTKPRKKKLWRIQVVNSCTRPVDSAFWWRLRAPNGEIVAGAERKTAKKVFALFLPGVAEYGEVEE